jgi:hypothetical protein
MAPGWVEEHTGNSANESVYWANKSLWLQETGLARVEEATTDFSVIQLYENVIRRLVRKKFPEAPLREGGSTLVGGARPRASRAEAAPRPLCHYFC